MPNHMENLTIWNFYATNAQTDQDIDTGGKFTWWDGNGFWWKFMPPIIVGFHGSPLDFDDTQMKRLESNGTPAWHGPRAGRRPRVRTPVAPMKREVAVENDGFSVERMSS